MFPALLLNDFTQWINPNNFLLPIHAFLVFFCGSRFCSLILLLNGGYVIDRRQGNTGGRGGLLGPLYAIGKGFPFPEGQPYDAWASGRCFTAKSKGSTENQV